MNDHPATHHLVAFSGGVDSSLVAALVHRVGGAQQHDAATDDDDDDRETRQSVVRAVLGLSPAVPQEQRDLAFQVAHQIGIPLETVQTQEGSDDTYIANAGQACLACKTHLYSSLQAIVEHYGVSSKNNSHSNANGTALHHSTMLPQDETSVNHPKNKDNSNTIINLLNSVTLYNGTNADDLHDATRVGLVAAQHFGVVSPLRHCTKSQVRAAARHLGLMNWNYAASSCLRSRLALGVQATRDHLARIERAEGYLRQHLLDAAAAESDNLSSSSSSSSPLLLFDETSNLRVRLLSNNRACIELDEGAVLDHAQEQLLKKWEPYFVNQLGFARVQLRAFRSGSVSTKDGQRG